MDNINNSGADGYSIGGFLMFIFINIMEYINASSVTMILAWTVGGTTLLYNVIRIYKELKNK